MTKTEKFVFVYLVLACLLQSLAIASHEHAWSFVDRTEPLRIPEGWMHIGDAPPHEPLKITFALKQSNVDRFLNIFWEVTNPQSAHYASYLSIDEITEILAPSEATVHAVLSWLDSHNIKKWSINKNKDFVTVEIPVFKAEKLLNTKYHTWRHEETEAKVIRTLGPYTVPHEVSKSLDFIIGGIGLPRVDNAMRIGPKRGSVIPATPEIIRQRYNVSKNALGGHPGNRQAAAEFLNNFYSPEDLKQFFDTFWPNKQFNRKVGKVIGENRAGNPTPQASVDIQYLMGVAPNVTTWYWSNTGSDFWSDLTEWMNQISSAEILPLVHVLGYGNQGDGPSQEYRDRMNTEFAKVGVRGASILVASGDYGTGCYLCFYYEPNFPATSPFVTSVGATKFAYNKVGPEAAADIFSSGGGFSWHFEQPTYQTAVVTHYFATMKTLPDSHFYNGYGRGFPDVSALGTGYQVIVGTQELELWGTGPATATFAALVSLLNEARLTKGWKPLGFLNPLLYQIASMYPDAFFDPVQGSNQYGCCGWTGFYAAPGWDPVTGLGTPNFWILQKIVSDKGFKLQL